MVTQFSCSSSPTFLVTEELANDLFNTIGKKVEPDGIISNTEFETILDVLTSPKLKNKMIGDVPLATRLYPLRQMIKKAKNSKDNFILWKSLS